MRVAHARGVRPPRSRRLLHARLCASLAAADLSSQTPADARAIVDRAADAICDRARILAARTLTIEVQQHIARQIENARAFCASVAAGLSIRGGAP